MGKTDIERIRLEAVQRVIRGESPENVIVEYDFARSCIYDWLKRHREGGDDALRSRRSPGRPPSLSNEDYKQLLEALLKPPRSLGAWTMTDLLHSIRNRLGIEPGRLTAWRILRRMGIVPVGLWSPGKTTWRQAHPGQVYGQIYFVGELTTSVTSDPGGVKDYGLLVASTPRNRALFQLYSEVPSKQTFERFIYKLMPPADASTTLVLSSRSPRYPQAIDLALELSHDKNANLPPDVKSREQVVGEERDRLSSGKRYHQPLVIYRREA